jgi:hypothetical protein
VGLSLDGINSQSLVGCYADGTNCSTGYHTSVNSGSSGSHTLQFTFDNGSCLCNTTSFTTNAVSAAPSCTSAGPAGNDTISYDTTGYDVYAYGVAAEMPTPEKKPLEKVLHWERY